MNTLTTNVIVFLVKNGNWVFFFSTFRLNGFVVFFFFGFSVNKNGTEQRKAMIEMSLKWQRNESRVETLMHDGCSWRWLQQSQMLYWVCRIELLERYGDQRIFWNAGSLPYLAHTRNKRNEKPATALYWFNCTILFHARISCTPAIIIVLLSKNVCKSHLRFGGIFRLLFSSDAICLHRKQNEQQQQQRQNSNTPRSCFICFGIASHT